MKRYWDFVIITALAIVIVLLLFTCDRKCPDNINTTITIHDTIEGDSIPYVVYCPKPIYIYRDTGSIRYKDIDTTDIIYDYFAEKYYSDTIKDDTSALIVLNELITQNDIYKRNFWFQNRRKTSITTTTTNEIIGEIPRNKFYLGAGIEGEVNPFFRDPTITLNGLLVMKKRWAYEVEVGFPLKNINNVRIGVKGYYKLSFKKK
jgi:hypothetical protein